MSDGVGLWLLADFFGRALGMMLIGVAAYRSGFVTGEWEARRYRNVVKWNLPLGIALSTLGLIVIAVNDHHPGVAIASTIPNTLATLPMVAAYVSLITLWHLRSSEGGLDLRLQAVGRMALTNYLSQTVLMTVLFAIVLDGVGLGRAALLVVAAGTWALQLWWSKAWLDRFRQGPVEWLWRAATYRSLRA
jgi:uncharacterized protein